MLLFIGEEAAPVPVVGDDGAVTVPVVFGPVSGPPVVWPWFGTARLGCSALPLFADDEAAWAKADEAARLAIVARRKVVLRMLGLLRQVTTAPP